MTSSSPASSAERTLRIGEEAPGLDPRTHERVWAETPRGAFSCRARSSSLPFFDGAFDRVALRASIERFRGSGAEDCLREVQRVVRPEGCYAIETEARGWRDRMLFRRLLRRAGLQEEAVLIDRVPGRLSVRGTRRIGVSPEVWCSLATGSKAVAWNDSMFEFQQTPYDPSTLAGRIFLQRVHRVVSLVGRLRGARILEIGCEAGGLLRHLPPELAVFAIDLSGSALQRAKATAGGQCRGFVLADATQPLPFRDGTFDVVIASEVLEHCRSPHRVVAAIHRLLKPDGRAVVSIPNERVYLRWKAWLRRLPVARRALRGIEEGPAAWHVHHDFDRPKLLSLVRGFFDVERESAIWGTTLVFRLRKSA